MCGRGRLRISPIGVIWWYLRWFMCICRRMGGMNWGMMGNGSNVCALCSHYVRNDGGGGIWSGNRWWIMNVR